MKRSMRRRLPDPPQRESSLPVIWTVSISRLTRLISDIVPEYDAQADIRTFNLGFEEAARQVRNELERQACDVIIAAGSNGAYLKGRVPKPIVLVKANGFDLMEALARARKVSDHIGLITHQTELPAFAEFQDSFQLQIPQRTYLTAEDARSAVAELAARGVRVVVGTGLAVELADQAGLTGVLLYSAGTVRAAFESALDIARATQGPRSASGKSQRLSRRGAAEGAETLLGQSKGMQALRETLQRYAATDATVCIHGETGTGKELAARALHEHSPRHAQSFVAVNCGALTESLLESELFGYDEGAFTGSRRGGRVGLIEAADGGTLLLDEIGEMPLALQTHLLRVLEEREVLRVGSSRPIPVNIRVVVSTHRDLAALVNEGNFRRDLYYRLNVLNLTLPPLREHREDIPALAAHFLRLATGGTPPPLNEALLDLLRQHHWPGNVRELRNLMQRLELHVRMDPAGRPLDVPGVLALAPELGIAEKVPVTASAEAARSRPSRSELNRLMQQAQGHHQRVAQQLGVSRTTLWRWLRDSN